MHKSTVHLKCTVLISLCAVDGAFHAVWFVFDMVGTSQEQKGERSSKGQARGEERRTSSRERRGSCRKWRGQS